MLYMSPLFLLILITFLAGIYFCIKYSNPDYREALTNISDVRRCPDLLIQKGSRFYLHNSKVAQVPGVNPIEFENLEDYTEFLDWQHSQGIRCPVLYLQQSYDTQGQEVFKVRPSVSNLQGGLPPSAIPHSPNPTQLIDATRNDAPYNVNSYPGFDTTSYYVGATTPLDKMNEERQSLPISPDPMDPNWGGAGYTQSLVDQGYYKDNEVSIAIA